MAHSLTSGMLAATQADVVRPIIFVEIDTSAGNVYFWSGYGNFLWNSITWTGGGNLIDIGAITEQNRVQASGCVLSLTGINTAMIATVLTDLRRYMPAKIWLGAIDNNYQLIADPFQILNGRIDSANITATGKTSTIQITVESRLIAMRNPKWRRYTDLDQRIECPNDAGFTMVDTIQDATINFHGAQ